jgi:hypothetical protein
MDTTSKFLLPITAGILLILSGFFAIIVWISLFSNEKYIIYGIIGCILAIFPILAGIFAIKRKIWIIAFIGSSIGLFTLLTPLIISGIFASIGFIIIVISRKEFH